MPIDKISLINNNLNLNKINNSNGNVDFSKLLKDKIEQLNEKQIEAENKTVDFVKGEVKDVHEVMLSVEEARLSLELAVQIRNKIVEAIQEINRMQI